MQEPALQLSTQTSSKMIFGTIDLGYFQAISIAKNSVMHNQYIRKPMAQVAETTFFVKTQSMFMGMSRAVACPHKYYSTKEGSVRATLSDPRPQLSLCCSPRTLRVRQVEIACSISNPYLVSIESSGLGAPQESLSPLSGLIVVVAGIFPRYL